MVMAKVFRWSVCAQPFDSRRHAISPGSSATLTLPDYERVARDSGGIGHIQAACYGDCCQTEPPLYCQVPRRRRKSTSSPKW